MYQYLLPLVILATVKRIYCVFAMTSLTVYCKPQGLGVMIQYPLTSRIPGYLKTSSL